MDHHEIRVECRSGYKVNESPEAFTLQGRRVIVTEILDRWYEGGMTPDKTVLDYFKVGTDTGEVYLLAYNRSEDRWLMVP